MTKIALTATQIATLIGARGSRDQSAVKKDVFATLRRTFSIPSSIKLKVEIDNRNDPTYGVLKDKATGYALLKGYSGAYNRLDTPPAPAPVAMAQQQGSVSVSNPVTVAPAIAVRKISRSHLLSLLRQSTAYSGAHSGSHPVLSNVDSLGLDQSTGDLYFRTR